MLKYGALLGVFCVVAASSCRTGRDNPLSTLQQAVEGYHHHYRWRHYENASIYIPQEHRASFLEVHEEKGSDLEITNYSVTRVNLENEDHAEVRVQIQYMLLPSVTVQKTTVNQEWHRFESGWILESEDGRILEFEPEAHSNSDKKSS